ncbi:MAG: hypothetical protein WDW36_002124 [Sanguina aurantia]
MADARRRPPILPIYSNNVQGFAGPGPYARLKRRCWADKILDNRQDGLVIMLREPNFKVQARADRVTAALTQPPADRPRPQPPPAVVEFSSMGSQARSGFGVTTLILKDPAYTGITRGVADDGVGRGLLVWLEVHGVPYSLWNIYAAAANHSANTRYVETALPALFRSGMDATHTHFGLTPGGELHDVVVCGDMNFNLNRGIHPSVPHFLTFLTSDGLSNIGDEVRWGRSAAAEHSFNRSETSSSWLDTHLCTAAVCASHRVGSILPYEMGVSDHRPIAAEILLHSPLDSRADDRYVRTPGWHAVDPRGACVTFEGERAVLRAAGLFRRANNGISLAADRRARRNRANREKTVAKGIANENNPVWTAAADAQAGDGAQTTMRLGREGRERQARKRVYKRNSPPGGGTGRQTGVDVAGGAAAEPALKRRKLAAPDKPVRKVRNPAKSARRARALAALREPIAAEKAALKAAAAEKAALEAAAAAEKAARVKAAKQAQDEAARTLVEANSSPRKKLVREFFKRSGADKEARMARGG